MKSNVHGANSPRPTALDLFSGCGGLTVGLKQAGFEVLGAVEIDSGAVSTYKLNHPTVHVWDKDITTIKGRSILRKLKLKKGQLDLLAGCPPCQGFSTMRTLNGKKTIDDPQNSLLLEFLRLAEELRPRAVMMENVPGLAKDARFLQFRQRLAELGYSGDFRVLNAAEYRIPQRRRRLIYLAAHQGRISFAKPSSRKKTVHAAISKLSKAGESGDSIHDLPEQRSKKVLKLIRTIPKDGGSRTDLSRRRQLTCHKRCDGFKDVYGRMSWSDVAPTITSGCFNPSKGRFLHPSEDRAITIREAALLQGFPRKYRFDATHGKVAIALMIGNALPPPFVRAHAHKVRTFLLKKTCSANCRGSDQDGYKHQSGTK